ncbi:MAG: quinone-dependent dihydroorotate dehydrogenase [Burkholderiales bacterium]
MLSALYALVRPALRLVDAETAHHLSIFALKHGPFSGRAAPDDPILATKVLGIDFPNPIGLAAGYDKDAEVMDAMLSMGFGFVEAGTVTPLAQPGNPKPRLFRLDEDEAVINRFGFNSEGLAPFVERLRARRGAMRPGIVGANVGKNKTSTDAIADFVAGIAAVAPHADYLVVNISSPNTPGLRALQARDQVEALLHAVLVARRKALPDATRHPPLLMKIAPDLTEAELADIAEVALSVGIDGLIVGNTTIDRPDTLRSAYRGETGGLSGRPLFLKANACLSSMYRYTKGKLPIVGCGGVASGEDAYAKIRSGASLVQVYSALVFGGPGLVLRIKRDLEKCLRRDEFRSVDEAVGVNHR